MILAPLCDFRRYVGLSPGVEAGFVFLRSPDVARLEDGQYAIMGDEVFAIVARGEGRGRDASPLEYHRRYLDIQLLLAGEEEIGWRAAADCSQPSSPFDVDRDLGFYNDRPSTWCALQPREFAIFFPEDAHAPLAGHGPVHKIVVKVKLD